MDNPAPGTDRPRGTAPSLEIPADIVEAMVDHCRREAPLECCGILGGIGERVSSFHPLRNIAASQTRYDADPQDLIKAWVWLRENGREIAAIYHSHPRWEAVPSAVDLKENHYGPVPRIIVSLLTEPPEVRVWRLEPETYQELPWSSIDPVGVQFEALQRAPRPD
jgi:[CysO sulfur-carrier protein]-S-L-cysteine hydrolase